MTRALHLGSLTPTAVAIVTLFSREITGKMSMYSSHGPLLEVTEA